ncbi:hypothetical protein [Dyella sp. S184]|uniref:hypothetical protein n=1 Tax=Dyella sp. S184 TaxID=1641862 RepID=UPI00131E55BA|nr:hypothetical protein [Dyella sp. S184]
MDAQTHAEMLRSIAELRDLLGRHSSKDVLAVFASNLRKNVMPGEGPRTLSSPLRQTLYAIGLLQQTGEPEQQVEFAENDWGRVIQLLHDIFISYAQPPPIRNDEERSARWRAASAVAMPAFIHYFYSGTIASVEQIDGRTIAELRPFNDIIVEAYGLSVDEALEVAKDIGRILQHRLDDVYDLGKSLDEFRQEMMVKARSEKWDRSRFDMELVGAGETSARFHQAIDEMYEFKSEELRVRSDVVERFLSAFTLRRGENISMTYITEANPAQFKPLFRINEESYFCPSPNHIHDAIRLTFESSVIKSRAKDRYLRNRDALLERKAKSLMAELLDEGAVIYSNLCETQDAQFEHDVIAVSDRNLYIVEAKASPPPAPFRDPERAYTRIQHHFASNRGIQKAFDQSEHLRRRLDEEGVVALFSSEGEEILSLVATDYDNVFSVCFMRDDYGPLATNLDLLLEKPEDVPYPWVICEFDMESLVQTFRHIGMHESDLTRYLGIRRTLHGRVWGSDELEYAGFHIMHEGLEKIPVDDGKMYVLNPNYSDIFDEIYLAELTGETITVTPTPPAFRRVGGSVSQSGAKSYAAEKKTSNNKGKAIAKRKSERKARRKSRKHR